MKLPFKVGDKVRLVKRGTIGWEDSDYTRDGDLEVGIPYTVMQVNSANNVDYTKKKNWDINYQILI